MNLVETMTLRVVPRPGNRARRYSSHGDVALVVRPVLLQHHRSPMCPRQPDLARVAAAVADDEHSPIRVHPLERREVDLFRAKKQRHRRDALTVSPSLHLAQCRGRSPSLLRDELLILRRAGGAGARHSPRPRTARPERRRAHALTSTNTRRTSFRKCLQTTDSFAFVAARAFVGSQRGSSEIRIPCSGRRVAERSNARDRACRTAVYSRGC